jgi:hypothetical protein
MYRPAVIRETSRDLLLAVLAVGSYIFYERYL